MAELTDMLERSGLRAAGAAAMRLLDRVLELEARVARLESAGAPTAPIIDPKKPPPPEGPPPKVAAVPEALDLTPRMVPGAARPLPLGSAVWVDGDRGPSAGTLLGYLESGSVAVRIAGANFAVPAGRVRAR
jgi:hypothetical protein